MRTVLQHSTPRSFVNLRQLNRAWQYAATTKTMQQMLVTYSSESSVDNLTDVHDEEDIIRALRRQHRFETIFTARLLTLEKTSEFNNNHTFSQRKDVFISVYAGSTLVRWDLPDGEETTIHSGANQYYWGADRSELVYAEEVGSVFLLSEVATVNEAPLDLHFGFDDITLALDYEPEYQVVAAGSWAGTCVARAIDGPDGTVVLPAMGHWTIGFDVKIVDRGRQVIHTGPDHTRTLTQLSEPAQGKTLPADWDGALWRSSPSSSYSDATVMHGSVYLVDFGTWPIGRKLLLPNGLQIFGMKTLTRGGTWVTIGRDKKCQLWRMEDDRPVCLWKTRANSDLTRIWVSSSSNLFAYGDTGGTLHIR